MTTTPDTANRVTVKPGREKERLAVNAEVAQAIRDGAALEERKKIIDDQLAERKETIRAYALSLGDAVSVITLSSDDGEAKVTFKDRVAIPDADALRAHLGDRFADLVTVETKYKPSAALVDQASSGDGDPELRRLLTVKAQTPAVAFKRKFD